MNTQKYAGFHRERHKKLKRRITGAAIAVFAVLAVMFLIGKLTEDSEQYRTSISLIEENRALREQITSLTQRVAELEGTISEQESYISQMPAADRAEATEAPAAENDFTAQTPRDGQ